MKWSSSRLAIGSIFTFIAALSACTPTNKVKPGAPVLVAFTAVAPDGTAVDPSMPAPPLSSIHARFDRILDPDLLEAVDSDGGIVPKGGVATVSWTGGPIEAATVYNPNGHYKLSLIPAAFFGVPYGVGPSVTVIPATGLPSAATVTVTLDPNKVRSHDGTTPFVVGQDLEGNDVVSPAVFHTAPLAVSTDAPLPPPPDGGADDGGAPPEPAPPVAADFILHLTFNNFTPDSNRAGIQVTVTVGGAPVAGLTPVLAHDAPTAAGWTVSPPASGWPAGAVVTVTVAATVTDLFLIPLGAAATTTFTVAP